MYVAFWGTIVLQSLKANGLDPSPTKDGPCHIIGKRTLISIEGLPAVVLQLDGRNGEINFSRRPAVLPHMKYTIAALRPGLPSCTTPAAAGSS
jgi:hypothetical protein